MTPLVTIESGAIVISPVAIGYLLTEQEPPYLPTAPAPLYPSSELAHTAIDPLSFVTREGQAHA